MNITRTASSLILSLMLLGTQFTACSAGDKKGEPAEDVESQGTTPISSPSAMGGLGAPGADALMTPDLLLVNPSGSNSTPPQPLKAYIGTSVTLSVERYDITFGRLTGILITVMNETNRPLVINGEHANAVVGGKSIPAVRVSALQQIAVPRHADQFLDDLVTKVVPAAVTIGAAPTIRDIKIENKPVLQRYGPDEVRRKVESTRFGRRVLWPRQKTRGVLYFDTLANLNHATVEIPTSTLFDMTDSGTLSSASSAAVPPGIQPAAPRQAVAPAQPSSTEPPTPALR